MADNAQGPKRGLTRPIEVVRAELMKDPEIAKIAKAAGMELAAFVEKALEYAQDKDKEPVFNVAEDDELKAAGFNVPSEEEVAKLLIKVAKGELGVNEEYEKSQFEGNKPKGPSLS
jgi:hypothetical protein